VTPLVSFYDTATEPTEAMRDAMRAAEVGDDVYGRDPTVRALEQRGAELVGKERAVFMPSGTMANLAAIMAHTRRGEAVLLERESHVAGAEAGGVAIVAGCMPLEVPGRGGVLHPDDVEARLAPPDEHRPVPRLLCVENTHNRAGGTVTTPQAMRDLRRLCDRWDLRLHVDGARLCNAAVALDLPPAALAADADSVCVALSKGLGAPVGSLLAGTAEFVAAARRARKLLGGGMRQAGVLAAAALVALDGWEQRLAEDHRRAARLARRLAGVRGLVVDPDAVVTNIVMCELEPGLAPAAEIADWLLVRGVACSTTSERGLRFVVHGQIGDAEVERLGDALAEAPARLVPGSAAR
jgi:threonine aldolase